MWKTNTAGRHISNAWEQIFVNTPFSVPFLVPLSEPGQTTFLHSCSVSSSVFVCLVNLIWKLKRSPVSLSFVTSYPLTNLVWNYPTPLLAHRRPQQVSPISKVKPLTVSWRAAIVLTRLSLYATPLSRLGDRHLNGTDRSTAHSSYLPLSPVNSTSRCCEQLLPWRHKNTLCLRDSGEPKTERGRDDAWW